jgi:hypothetical protein
MTEYNFVMMIISIIMVVFFAIAWLVTEENVGTMRPINTLWQPHNCLMT